MATILIDDISLEIDLLAWANERLQSVKQRNSSWISACCPFHDDRSPSFAVNADDGHYVCQACGSKGGFAKLVAHVEKTTLADAERGLIAKYARSVPSMYKPLELDFGEKTRRERKVIEERALSVPFGSTGHKYVAHERGISDVSVRLFGVGYEGLDNALIFAYRDFVGNVVAYKRRFLGRKSFSVEGSPKNGLFDPRLMMFAAKSSRSAIIVCEGEFDAMSVDTANPAEWAVALGGSNVSVAQVDLLKRLARDELIVFHDNDRAGRKMLDQIVRGVGSSKTVTCVDWSLVSGCKDANDVLVKHGPAKVREMIDKRVPAPLTLTFE